MSDKLDGDGFQSIENGATADEGMKAHTMAKKLRDISVAEFFEKNRHLLGFDNKRKALLTAVKEAVDNSLDACEEARILPEIIIETTDLENDRFRVVIEDNGPGIVKEQIPKIFAKLLYGSKFHKLSQSRGQQGIGISSAVLYAQLTTGKPVKIISKISPTAPAHYYELHIDTQKNKPDIVAERTVEWKKEHGTRIEMEIEASYMKGPQSVDEYVKQTAIINPHGTFIFTNPKAEHFVYSRVSEHLPMLPREIKPHPYGVEIGLMMRMLKESTARTLQSFLTTEFSRVGAQISKEICENAALLPSTKPSDMSMQMTQKLIEGVKKTRIIAPPVDCISPLGEELILKGLKKEINAEFYCSATRPASVYRGNPFVIEAGIAYGGELSAEGQVSILRCANRVPLLYQQGACAITEAVTKTKWKSYGLQQSSYSIPVGPAVILVHISSVWVPFTSEAKEAIAHYPEIMREVKLIMQECGRKLAHYVRKKHRVNDELKKRGYIEVYIPHITAALKEIMKSKDFDEGKIELFLREILEKTRMNIEETDNDEHHEDDDDNNKYDENDSAYDDLSLEGRENGEENE